MSDVDKNSEIQQSAELDFAPKIVLFATDFSPACDDAWVHALAVARKYQAKLLLTHVLAPSLFAAVPAELAPQARERARQEAEGRLKRLQQPDGRAPRLNSEVLLAEGEVGEVLLRTIRDSAADLVVVGTRGRRELERLLLGSVAEKLFRQAACPVLVVPGGARSAGDTPIHRILCPIDFSADSPAALALSTSIASHYNAQLIVLHVLQQSTASGESRGTAKSTEERLQRLLDSKRDRLLNPQIEVASGTSVAKSIARAVVEYGCDLVVVAVHPAGVATAHEPERNAYRIIRWSDSPVLTIPRGYAQAG